MKRAELFLFVYSVTGLLAFNVLCTSFETENKSFTFNKDIPRVQFSKLFLHDNTVDYIIKNKKPLETQVVLYNTSVPDTFCIKVNAGSFPFVPANAWMVREPSSAKQRAPTNDFSNVFVMASRHISPTDHECGEWTYTTLTTQKNEFNSVSIISNPAIFFDFENGIYVNGSTHLYENTSTKFNRAWWLNPGNWGNRGKEWERELVFQYLNPSGKILFTANSGIRIHGNATRGFPQKSLRFIAAKKYGKKSFHYNFFSEKTEDYKSLVLRNSGNDWGRTMFADFFIQSCIPEDFIDKQNFQAVDVYINGFYWGIYNMCERPDEDYLARKYNAKKKNITLVEGELLDYGNENVKNDYTGLIKDCWSNKLNEEQLFNKLKEKIDLDNFAAYIAIQLYCVNVDLESPNVKVFCIKNGKWRWIIKDLDCSYSYSGNEAYTTDMFQRLLTSASTAGVLFKACFKSKIFQRRLNEKITYLLNGPLSKETQMKKINEFSAKFEKSIQKQISRWRKPVSLNAWKSFVKDFAEFIELREDEMKKQMKKYMALD